MEAILIGFMGSGKTTIGKLVAQHLNVPHVDLDDQITAAAGIPIKDIFAKHGEAYFRQLEHKLLLQQMTEHGILSTGGGTSAQPENMRVLKQTTVPVIFLEATAATILKRVCNDQGRPLVNQLDQTALIALKQSRQQAYQACADLTIATDQTAPDQIAQQILNYLRQAVD
ncbi:shikimate kinase [Liquorilactobacillus satsumensis]|uniref:shikimate kinase n=1 Tax=Liquorilactobacillus satsumensis TaxID=259059 RepID=UPI0021C47762|nr:shikimate kinase [Liquorilactobacillus satsumensis]MCP9328778.1 shikimate kinase [Liquorilactobacillus satsumensis]